jgi:hypothetical protein
MGRSSDVPASEDGGFVEARPSRLFPDFPLSPQNLFLRGGLIKDINLRNVSTIGLSICSEIEEWKGTAGVVGWPDYADRELAALNRAYDRMHGDVPFGIRHSVNVLEVRRLLKMYLDRLQNDRHIFEGFIGQRYTLYFLSVDFADTIGCGSPLQTSLQWYG